jgi:hypothetical protein
MAALSHRDRPRRGASTQGCRSTWARCPASSRERSTGALARCSCSPRGSCSTGRRRASYLSRTAARSPSRSWHTTSRRSPNRPTHHHCSSCCSRRQRRCRSGQRIRKERVPSCRLLRPVCRRLQHLSATVRGYTARRYPRPTECCRSSRQLPTKRQSRKDPSRWPRASSPSHRQPARSLGCLVR